MRACIAAVVSLQQPVPPGELHDMARRARIPVRTRVANVEDGSFGVVSRASAPRIHVCEHSIVALDGVIDNSRPLAEELQVKARSHEELIGAAYLRWGYSTPKRLHGDFALIVVDRKRRRVLCARDPIGIRELFYEVRAERVYVASQIWQLQAARSPQVNLEYIADYFAAPLASSRHSALRGAQKLAAGEQLTVDTRGVRRAVAKIEPVSFHRLGEAALEFRERLKGAVKRCTRSRRVWSHLSGGLDSSAVACIAARQQQKRFRVLTDMKMLGKGEKLLVDEILRTNPLKQHQLNYRTTFFSSISEAASFVSEPSRGMFALAPDKASADLLESLSTEVLLTGIGAEVVALPEAQEPIHLARYLKNWRLRTLAKEVARWQRAWHVPYANMLFAYGVRPLFNPLAKACDQRHHTTWLTTDFSKRMNLRDRARALYCVDSETDPDVQLQRILLQGISRFLYRGYLEWHTELRYPFLDRDLVEFAISLPWEVRLSPHADKHLLREATSGILPEAVRRAHKQPPDLTAYFRDFTRNWPELGSICAVPLLADLGIIDATDFTRTAESWRNGSISQSSAFLTTLALECWLRHALNVTFPANNDRTPESHSPTPSEQCTSDRPRT